MFFQVSFFVFIYSYIIKSDGNVLNGPFITLYTFQIHTQFLTYFFFIFENFGISAGIYTINHSSL